MALTDCIERKAWMLGRFIAKTLATFSLDNVRANLSSSLGVETTIKLSSSGLTCGNKRSRSFVRIGPSDRTPYRFYDLSLVNNIYQDQLKSVLVCIVRLADIREYNYEILVFRVVLPDDAIRFEKLFRMLTFSEPSSPVGVNPVNGGGRDLERSVEKLSSSRDQLVDTRREAKVRLSDTVDSVMRQHQLEADESPRHAASSSAGLVGTVPEKAPRHSLRTAAARGASHHRQEDDNNNSAVAVNRELGRKASQRSVAFGGVGGRTSDNGYAGGDDVLYVRDVGTSTKSAMLAERYDADGNQLTVNAEPTVCELFCFKAKTYQLGSKSMAEVCCQATIVFSLDDRDVAVYRKEEAELLDRSAAAAISSRGRTGGKTSASAAAASGGKLPKSRSSKGHKSRNLDSVVEIEETSDSRDDDLTTERSSEEGDYVVKHQERSPPSHQPQPAPRTLLDTGTVRVTVEPPQDDDDDDEEEDLDEADGQGLGEDGQLTFDGRFELGSEKNEPIYAASSKKKPVVISSGAIEAEIHSEEGAGRDVASAETRKSPSEKSGPVRETTTGTLRQKLAEKNSKRDAKVKPERKQVTEKSSFTLGSLWRKSGATSKKSIETADTEPGVAKITIDTSSDVLQKKSVKIDPSSIHVILEPTESDMNGSTIVQKPKDTTRKKESRSGWNGRHSSMDSLNFSAEPARVMLSRKVYGQKSKNTQSFDSESQPRITAVRPSDEVEVQPSNRNHLIANTSYDNIKTKGRKYDVENREYGRPLRSIATYEASESTAAGSGATEKVQEESGFDEWDNGSNRVYARFRPKSYSSDNEVAPIQPARLTLPSDEGRRIRLVSAAQPVEPERPKSRSALMLNNYLSSPRYRSEQEQMRTSEFIRDTEQKRKKLFSSDQGRQPRGRVYTSERDLRAVEHRVAPEDFGRSIGAGLSDENYGEYGNTSYEAISPRGRLQSMGDGGTGYESDRLRGTRNTYVDAEAPRPVFRRSKGSSSGYDSGELTHERVVLAKNGGGNGGVWVPGSGRRVPSDSGVGRAGDSVVAVAHSRSYSVSRGDKYRRPVNW